MSKKKPKTENGIRTFNCKMCGTPVRIATAHWRKRPTKYKQMCENCLPKEHRRERPIGPYNADGRWNSMFNFKF